MNVSENLQLIRQNLEGARSLSGQARQNFQNIESGTSKLNDELAQVDTFQATTDTCDKDSSEVGSQAFETLSGAPQRLDGLSEEQIAQKETRHSLSLSLAAAAEQLDQLGLPQEETARLKGAISSALREESLGVLEYIGVETGLHGAATTVPGSLEAAIAVSQDLQGQDVSESGALLDGSVNELESRLQNAGGEASASEQRQGRVGGHVDFALLALESLETNYPSVPEPAPAPEVPPAPNYSAPIPTFSEPSFTAISSAPSSTSTSTSTPASSWSIPDIVMPSSSNSPSAQDLMHAFMLERSEDEHE